MIPRARPSTRRDAERFGRAAESLCVLALRLKGYRILARRVRTPRGEIDVVAVRGGVLAFVEVKARAVAAEADLVTARQRARVVAAAQAFAAHHPGARGLQPRFDVMLTRGLRWPRHLRDAFRADGV